MHFLTELVQIIILMKDQSIFPLCDHFISTLDLFFWLCINTVSTKIDVNHFWGLKGTLPCTVHI